EPLDVRPRKVERTRQHRVQPAAFERPQFAGCSGSGSSVKNTIAHISNTTPIVIAESATLNAGKFGTFTKSTTRPAETRSRKLPIAPPNIVNNPSRITGWANPGLNR